MDDQTTGTSNDEATPRPTHWASPYTQVIDRPEADGQVIGPAVGPEPESGATLYPPTYPSPYPWARSYPPMGSIEPVTPSPVPSPAAEHPLRRYLAVAAVAGLVGAGVAVPVTQVLTPAASVSALAPGTTFEPGTSLVAAIAAQVGPSVARVDVQGPRSSGSGSAVVYREDGYLVTNAHVVSGATTVTVTLPSGARHEATIVGVDTTSDLAVIRIDARDLPVPAYANAIPAVGETAIAIGSPFGLDGSVTAGIVSSLNRTVTGTGAPLIDLIQTDAAINPGNSGGALVSGSGEIIGINTAIISTTGGNDGIGFAIPVGTVRNVADQLISDGVVRHAYLGIQGQSVDAETAALYRLPGGAGAAIVSVVPGSPAATLGLQAGDIVTAVDGQEVGSMAEFAGRLQQHQPGDTVALTYHRDGRPTTADVTLGEQPGR